jgi:hypothetical protein
LILPEVVHQQRRADFPLGRLSSGRMPGESRPRSRSRSPFHFGYEPTTPPGLLSEPSPPPPHLDTTQDSQNAGFVVLTEKALELVCWSSGLTCQNLGPPFLGPVLEADLVEAFRRGVVCQGPGGRALLQESENSFVSLQDKALELVAWQAGKAIRILWEYPECGIPEPSAVENRVGAFRRGLLLQARPS